MSMREIKQGFWSTRRQLQFLRWSNDTRFAPIEDLPPLTEDALKAAKDVRGTNRPPAIMLHGVMPRSGTNLIGELLRLHPDVSAYPNQLWEIPFLRNTNYIIQLQEEFFRAYRHNAGRMGQLDFLPLFGASITGYLYSSVDPSKRLLVKTPDVQYLSYFYHVFPFENLLLVLRDGRDVVHSTLKTWPGSDFTHTCKTWNSSAKLLLRLYKDWSRDNLGVCWMAKFENAVQDPKHFVREACRYLGLDEGAYPFEEIEEVPVRGTSQPSGAKVSWEGQKRPENFNPVGRWQEWSGKWKKTFKRIAGSTLIQAGYSKDNDW